MLEFFAALRAGPLQVFDCSTCSLIRTGIGGWFTVGVLPGLNSSAQWRWSLPGRSKGVVGGFLTLCRTPLAEQLAVIFVRTTLTFLSSLNSLMLLDFDEFADSAGHAAAPKPFLIGASYETTAGVMRAC